MDLHEPVFVCRRPRPPVSEDEVSWQANVCSCTWRLFSRTLSEAIVRKPSTKKTFDLSSPASSDCHLLMRSSWSVETRRCFKSRSFIWCSRVTVDSDYTYWRKETGAVLLWRSSSLILILHPKYCHFKDQKWGLHDDVRVYNDNGNTEVSANEERKCDIIKDTHLHNHTFSLTTVGQSLASAWEPHTQINVQMWAVFSSLQEGTSDLFHTRIGQKNKRLPFALFLDFPN